MILNLSNGQIRKVAAADVIIVPTVSDEKFNIANENTWESDRAWLFAKPGQRIWTGAGNSIATILSVHN